MNTLRRTLSILLAVGCLMSVRTSPTRAADSLQVMPADSFDRLKFDFNSNRSAVRLVFVLSPT